jgi:hypothetical protein
MKTLFLLLAPAAFLVAQPQPVSIQFKAVVGDAALACGKSYPNIGTTKSTISPRDFRFYIHNVRLLDHSGHHRRRPAQPLHRPPLHSRRPLRKEPHRPHQNALPSQPHRPRLGLERRP